MFIPKSTTGMNVCEAPRATDFEYLVSKTVFEIWI